MIYNGLGGDQSLLNQLYLILIVILLVRFDRLAKNRILLIYGGVARATSDLRVKYHSNFPSIGINLARLPLEALIIYRLRRSALRPFIYLRM